MDGHGLCTGVCMTPEELQERTLAFALRVYRFVLPLFRDPTTRHVAQQLFRSSTSLAANYRAACLARSPREWLAKIGIVREESDETQFWIIFAGRSEMCPGGEELAELTDESGQLARIFAAAYRTSRRAEHRKS